MPTHRQQFEQALAEAACTRDAVDGVFARFYPQEHAMAGRYPDEWYADKDNRLNGCPAGHLSYQSGRVTWVRHADVD